MELAERLRPIRKRISDADTKDASLAGQRWNFRAIKPVYVVDGSKSGGRGNVLIPLA